MKANINVTSRQEADAIRTGLEDPAVRAFVTIMGILKPMTKRAQARVLQYVTDRLAEDDEIRHEQAAHDAGNGNAGVAAP